MPETPQSSPQAGLETGVDSAPELPARAFGGTPTSSPPCVGSSDIDLYCLTCGYNLRGLTGDPRRCPECGGLNPVGDVMLPAAIITEQLQRMETAPAFCLAALLAAAAFCAVFALLLSDQARIGEIVPCMVVLLSLLAMAWGVSVDRFRVSCMSKPGWQAALVRYHVWGLGLVLAVFGPTASIMWAASSVAPSYQMMIALPAFMLSAAALGLVTVWPRPPLIARMYARAREDLDVLQREVAVTLARDRTRKALHRQRR